MCIRSLLLTIDNIQQKNLTYVLNSKIVRFESDLVRFRYRSVYIPIQVRSNKMQHNFLWQLSDSKSKYMSDSKCNRMCNSSVD